MMGSSGGRTPAHNVLGKYFQSFPYFSLSGDKKKHFLIELRVNLNIKFVIPCSVPTMNFDGIVHSYSRQLAPWAYTYI